MEPAPAASASKNRLAYFRELRARLDPSGDPARAMDTHYVALPEAISARLAAELSLAPASSHLLIGGVGSGKTTELLAAQRLLSRVGDTVALYIDVSTHHDIAKLTPGVVAVQVGFAIASFLGPEPAARAPTKLLAELAGGYTGDLPLPEHGEGFPVPGLLTPPDRRAEGVSGLLPSLAALARLAGSRTSHLVVLLDGLDRTTDVGAFEQLVLNDVEALVDLGIGVVLVGPLRALYGLDRTVVQRFDAYHYQPWIDVERSDDGRRFLSDVLRRRIRDAVSEPGLDSLVRASGGVLRDLLALTQAALVEAYMRGSELVSAIEVEIAVDTFGRKHLHGLGPAELDVLQQVRRTGNFIQTNETDLALLMTRRVLEYREQGHLRYAAHPTIDRLLAELSAR